jgi:ABC-type transport system involved in multi-copper enzyme maturation permease subunit
MLTTTIPTSTPAPAAVPRLRPLALRAEWTKFRTLRSSWLTLAISVIAGVALGAVATATDARGWDDMSAVQRADYDATSTSLVGVLFGALVLGALGVRSITAEYATGMIRTTAAAVPRRARFLASKVAIVAVTAFVAGLASNVAGFAVGQRILRTQDIHASYSDTASIGAILAGAAAVAAFAMIGVGVGAIVRRAAVANIVIALVVIGGQLFGSAMPMTSQRYLPFSALQASVTVHRADELLAPTPALLVLTAYTAVTLAMATYLVQRRDV